MSLKRVLGPLDAAWIVAGSMIGAGIFLFPGVVAGQLPGLVAPIGAWVLGGLLALCGAAVYAELGARLPRAGGDYQYLRAAFGPLWGFVTGWAAFLLTFSAASALMCNAALDHLLAAFPALARTPLGIKPLVAPLLALVLTGANVVGAKPSERMTAWLKGLPLAGLAALFGCGLIWGGAELDPPPLLAAPARPWLLALGTALIPIYYTYSGWSAAAYLAEEVRDPARTLARGLIGGTAAVMLVYLLVNTVLLLVVPANELAGSTTGGAHAARILLGPRAEQALAVCIAASILGAANVSLMAGARIYYAMAGDGLAPPALAHVNAAGVPSTSLWISGAWTALLATTTRIDTLMNWATLAILLLSSLAVAALFVLRRRPGPDPGFRCPGYPWTPVLYLVASLGVAAASAFDDPLEALYGSALVALGVPAYFVARRWF